jgi:predicted nuclease of predicted toxin-antitoxin system
VKLLLDEHLSPQIAVRLRAKGHDTVAVAERADLQGLSDRQLLNAANDDARVVVTENVADFVELHRVAVLRGREHHGIIFTNRRQFPRNREAIGRLVRALEALLAERPRTESLVLQTWWLQPDAPRQPST